jgi:hypothetical protein
MNQLSEFQAAQAEYDSHRAGEASNIDQLRAFLNAGVVSSRDIDFAASLVQAPHPSEKQLYWIGKLVDRYTPKPVAAPAARVGDVKGVVDLLERARANGLKFPKLWLKFANGDDLRISIAGEHSSTPGYLTLTDGGPFGANRYYGKVSPAGELKGRDDHNGELSPLLSRLAAEPAKVAAEFGHLTGHCCFCAKKLTDERSTHVGYGRTCARKFGMPWGEK